ncbi:hypothetical protein PRIPAC_97013, partial [Pristionchus pacificus]|uniref:Uncharacterized protein n=1 Tax=Pristionchus pacificus TaxID=54126 RepID=A0A2A6BJU4_PRIPA
MYRIPSILSPKSAFSIAIACPVCKDPTRIPSPYELDEHGRERLRNHLLKNHWQLTLTCIVNIQMEELMRDIYESGRYADSKEASANDEKMETEEQDVPYDMTVAKEVLPRRPRYSVQKHMRTCTMCMKTMHYSQRQVHVYKVHLGKLLFECPYCTFYSDYDKKKVESHLLTSHT